MRAIPVAVLGILAATLCGCSLAKVSGQGPLPLYLNQPPERTELVAELRGSKRSVFNYSPSYDLADIIKPSAIPAGATALTNIRVEVKWTAVDTLLNLLTLGLANSMTATVRANAVRAPAPAPQ